MAIHLVRAYSSVPVTLQVIIYRRGWVGGGGEEGWESEGKRMGWIRKGGVGGGKGREEGRVSRAGRR